MKYKFIFVIISSNELTIENEYYNSNDKYRQLKFWNKLYYDMFKDDIKFFYVEYNDTIIDNVLEKDHFIYVKGNNELPMNPNMLNKKLLAMEHIHSKYDYEYIINTNLTSIWNIPVLLSFYNDIPRYNFFGGHYFPLYSFVTGDYFPLYSFVTGTGIIMSCDLIPLLLKIPQEIQKQNNDDVVISFYMSYNNIPGFHLEKSDKYKVDWQTLNENCDDDTSGYHKNNITIIDDNTNTDNILYFRVRNGTIEQDLYITKKILNKLYNITIE